MRQTALLCALAMSSALPAQSQLRDINATSPAELASGSPVHTTVIGGVLYGFAEVSPYPFNFAYSVAGLWRSDGTPAGTWLVKEIDPGDSFGSTTPLFDVNGAILFGARVGGTSSSLFRTDGTSSGTTVIPGTSMAELRLGTLWNGQLWFIGLSDYQSNTWRLWRSDGTAAGTTVVATLSASVSDMRACGPYLYLTLGTELWRSDGTAAGTVPIAGTAGILPFDLVAVGTRLFFSADNGVAGRELWTSDGTAAGTGMVRDLNPGAAPSMPGFPMSVRGNLNGTLLFSADDGTNGMELWRSDGTAAGTVLVKDIAPGGTGSAPDSLTIDGSVAWFGAATAANGREVWRSDGTDAGTFQVIDLAPGAASSSPLAFTAVSGTLFFSARDSALRGHELWKTDGSVAGTVLVRDIAPGSVSSYPDAMVAFGNLVVFTANDGATEAGNRELWVSDGTPAGTALLRDFRPRQPSSLANAFAAFAGFARLGDRTVFAADNGSAGSELWISDGTPAGTVLLKDIRPGPASSSPASFTAVAGTVFFTADDGVSGREVWKTDGTPAGTVLMQELQPGSAGSSPYHLTECNGRLFWRAEDGTGGWLWTSDGTPTGAVRLLAPGGSGPSFPTMLVAVGTTLFCDGGDNTGVANLWKSDGTVAGTVKIRTLPGNRFPRVLGGAASGGKLFFVCDDGNFSGRGYELWRSDGTAAGTILLRDIAPGFGDSYPRNLTDHAGILYFTADDHLHNGDLWRSDGTTAGTFKVKVINPGGPAGPVGPMVSAGGTLFFSAFEAATGTELWKSDGTTAGTMLVRDINPGVLGSMPPLRTRLAAGSDARIVFAASDGASGVEVWTSDGTSASTLRVADLVPGPEGSDPDSFARAGVNLFFAATDGATGREPFVLPLASIEAPLVETFGTACPGTGGRRPRIGATGLPRIGTTFTPWLADAFGPAPCALFLHSLRAALPIGGSCTLYVPPPIPVTFTTGTDGAGNAVFPLPLPADTGLIGLELYLQWASYDPAGSYSSILTFSGALRVLVGR